jgi:hypothetical protein
VLRLFLLGPSALDCGGPLSLTVGAAARWTDDGHSTCRHLSSPVVTWVCQPSAALAALYCLRPAHVGGAGAGLAGVGLAGAGRAAARRPRRPAAGGGAVLGGAAPGRGRGRRGRLNGSSSSVEWVKHGAPPPAAASAAAAAGALASTPQPPPTRPRRCCPARLRPRPRPPRPPRPQKRTGCRPSCPRAGHCPSATPRATVPRAMRLPATAPRSRCG